MKLPTVKNERLYQKIANLIIELINNGTFNTGEYLPAERELSKSLGVSRSSLREALIVLEISGFIEIHSGSGIYVLNQRKNSETYSAIDLIKAREVVDSETAMLAALSTQQTMKKKLLELHSLMNFFIETKKTGEFYRVDKEFHMLIAELAHNKPLYDMADMLWKGRIDLPYATLDDKRSDYKVLKDLNQQHLKIYQAIIDKDPEKTKEASLEHISYVKKLWL